ncbi:MAG: DUF4175 domain-containing protein [Bacteroidetes bacterium]|nr:MAG: DUF4175 domain-containing protein [Bacteroidota bacterium]
MNVKDNYTLLIEKLDSFIRKFYLNRLIRGSLYSVGLILLLFLGVSLLENYFYFDSGVRKLLFYSFLLVSVGALGYWVFTPLMKYFRLGKVISHEQAASIIGDHFADVKDKLLNILQLRVQAESNSTQKDLILASIDQKSDKIKIVPFKSAINLGHNRKYLRYALPPLLLLLIILFAAPSLIKDSTNRLIKNNEDFKKPDPFSFVIDDQDLSVVQFDDYPLGVKIEGDEFPNEVFINVDNYQYRMTKVAVDSFSYRFSNVQKETEFKLFSSGVDSKDYTLNVLKKPNIAGFDVSLDYPAYTERKDEELNSVGDLVVPAGTNINWVFNALNTSSIKLAFSGETPFDAKRFDDDLFSHKKRVLKDQSYKLYVSNESLPLSDSISYSISVIPDLYPEISVEQFQDSTDKKLFFFVGDASDDYGLTSLSFNYRIKHEDDSEEPLQTIPVKNPDNKKVRYDYTFDLNNVELAPGDEVTFFFEVYDNDGVNGSKSSRTGTMVYSVPTVEEFEAMADKNDEKIKDDLSKAIEESKKLQEEMKQMREKLLQEKELDWKSKEELEKLLERQKDLEEQFQEAKEAFEENMKNQEEFTETDENIMEKQEQLQQLFEEVISEEMKELMKQIEELMQELEKDSALEMMEEMEMNDEEMEKELDRLLELYKQLEVEKEMQDAIEDLEELAEEQEELSEQTENEEMSQEELQEKQEEIQEKFEDIEKQIEETKKKNEELESPKNIGDHDQEMENIEQQMNESQEQLQQNENQKASESQKSASEKMKEMAQSMAMQMQAGEMEQMEEDMKALRQLLENLVNLSFDQEELMDNFGIVEINTPRYIQLVQEQFKLQDDFKLVEDSLQALSKRVMQIESFVTEKVGEIKGNMKKSISELEERQVPKATDHQQRSMKNLNDLALMLSEAMNQMQQQMSSMMPGSQMCNKPGGQGSSGSPKDKISKGQEKMNEEMKQMLENMKKGQGGGSKEFAQMAAKQAALRKALREKQKELQQQGKGSKELQDLIDQMNKVETDLVNKKLTNEMMKRQEDILTRLLQHEKAEREREFDKKRKAEVAEQFKREMPSSLQEYIKKREAEIELYKTVSPSLKPYYKQLVDEYFNSMKGN